MNKQRWEIITGNIRQNLSIYMLRFTVGFGHLQCWRIEMTLSVYALYCVDDCIHSRWRCLALARYIYFLFCYVSVFIPHVQRSCVQHMCVYGYGSAHWYIGLCQTTGYRVEPLAYVCMDGFHLSFLLRLGECASVQRRHAACIRACVVCDFKICWLSVFTCM